MRSTVFILTGIALVIVYAGCNRSAQESDAFGNFTATEILVSSEISGKVISKYAEEGETVDSGAVVYIIDTLQNCLKKDELMARKKSVLSKKSNLTAQIEVLAEQHNALKRDLDRFRNMYEEGAASQKQIDDLENNLTVIEKQIEQVRTNYSAIEAEALAMDASIAQVGDLIKRAVVCAPGNGTILETYAEKGETATPGKFLFKLADLRSMELKAYFSGSQLPLLKIGQEVDVLIDHGRDEIHSLKGTVSWISANAEFTPKIIQTREERVSQVYAVKISVNNDGTIKINMPGEVKIIQESK
jgi:HlyD family secretion protein